MQVNSKVESSRDSCRSIHVFFKKGNIITDENGREIGRKYT